MFWHTAKTCMGAIHMCIILMFISGLIKYYSLLKTVSLLLYEPRVDNVLHWCIRGTRPCARASDPAIDPNSHMLSPNLRCPWVLQNIRDPFEVNLLLLSLVITMDKEVSCINHSYLLRTKPIISDQILLGASWEPYSQRDSSTDMIREYSRRNVGIR